MISKPVLFGMLAAACIAAAGGGAYLASRPAGGPVPAVEAMQPKAAEPQGVHESEAVVPEVELERAKPVEKPVPPARPASARVTERPAPAPRVNAARPAAPARQSTRPPAPPAPMPEPRVTAERTPARDTGDQLGSGHSFPVDPESPTMAAPVEEARAPEPPARRYDELVISADSVIGLQVENAISSETAKVEDRVDARVTRDVRVGSDIAIPAGARARGSITLVERGGKVKERARLGIRFHTIVLADGTEVPLRTETIYREGDSPSRESAAKIGGAAVGGAILGAILGGKKGAVLGGAAGAAGGTTAVMAGDRNAATLPAGTTLTVRLSGPSTVTVER